MNGSRRKRIIITADDFGLNPAVNEAVERACTQGILTTTSLMVGQAASEDAVERATRLSQLKVGLHVALTDARSVLPPTEIPDLVDARGLFRPGMALAGVRFFFLPRVRRQLAAEILAQFNLFAATGLQLDHVNAHKHFHLHPTVLNLILEIGRDFGLRAVRLPREPLRAERGVPLGGVVARLGGTAFLSPWVTLMKARLERAKIAHNDSIFGLSATGRMDETELLAILAALPNGVTEIYLHPAVPGTANPGGAGDGSQTELAALTSPRVRAALERDGIERIAFNDLVVP